MYEPTPDLMIYLSKWLSKSQAYQTSNGVVFKIALPEFIQLIGPKRLKKLDTWLAEGFGNKMHRDNPYAWVLTWKEGRRCEIMDLNTARVTTREISKMAGRLKAGDKHSERAKERIGDAKRGKAQSEDHKRARSEVQKGVKRGPRDPEVTARILATKAAKKLENRND